VSVRPVAAALELLRQLDYPASDPIAALLRGSICLLASSKPAARLREISHRGVVSAAMISDNIPAIDLLRKEVDERSGRLLALMGLMDLRGLEEPLFFSLYQQGK